MRRQADRTSLPGRRGPIAAGLAWAVLSAGLGFASGPDAALIAVPALLVFSLLVAGRFVGEERVIARLAGYGARRPRPARPAPWRRSAARRRQWVLVVLSAPRRGPPLLAA